MESSRKPENTPPGQMMRKPLILDHRQRQHSQTDPFLTAARLLRGGWLEEGTRRNWKFSDMEKSAGQPPHPGSEEKQIPNRAEIWVKDPRTRRVIISNIRETRGDEKKTCEEKQKPDGDDALSVKRPTQEQAGQTGVVCVWRSGCRLTCRQPRRFKAPMLPVIAEM